MTFEEFAAIALSVIIGGVWLLIKHLNSDEEYQEWLKEQEK